MKEIAYLKCKPNNKKYSLQYKADCYAIASFIICIILSMCVFVPIIIKENGIFTLTADFNAQQIPFNTFLNGFFKSGGGQWSWSTDLGSQVIGAFSFYNIGSPFFWLTMLFDKNMFPYIVGWCYILKYAVSGVTSYYFFKIFIHDRKYAVIGSILYSFSGFQSENLLFYHFHDVVALFPVLLVGLEKMMHEKRYTLFIFSVFINCSTNYFFFIGEVIFLLFYFLFRFWNKPKVLFYNGFKCILCGIIGVGMSALTFIPSIIFIIHNSRAHISIDWHNLFGGIINILYLLKGMLFPPEAMHDQSAVCVANWTSASCYLPLIGLSFVLAYLLIERNWLQRLLIVLVTGAFLTPFSAFFYLFTTNYHRWWYMLVLMLVLASICVLEAPEKYNLNHVNAFYGLILIILVAVLVYINVSGRINQQVIYRNNLFIIMVLIAFFGNLFTIWIFSNHIKKKTRDFLLFIMITVFCVGTTADVVYLYRQGNSADIGEAYLTKYEVASKLDDINQQYRYDTNDNRLSLIGSISGIGSFNSTVNSSITEFQSYFDYNRVIDSMNYSAVDGLKELLGARYIISSNSEIMDSSNIIRRISANGVNYYIFQKQAAPIGFAYDTYLLDTELMKVPLEKRGLLVLNNLIISKSDENKVSGLLLHGQLLMGENDNLQIRDCVEKYTKNAVNNFKKDGSGFSCNSNYTKETIVYFSVPNDDGWDAYIDGKKTSILNSIGMMAIKVPKGEHEIEFVYQTPGLKISLVIFLVMWLLFIYILHKELSIVVKMKNRN